MTTASAFARPVQGGLRQPEWRNYQEFLKRLDEAIKQQLQAVHQQQSHTASGQAEWRQQRKRLQAFDALFERHRASEAKLEGRQEQKAQDEWAARRKHDKEDGE
jgi:flagellar FliJ protein